MASEHMTKELDALIRALDECQSTDERLSDSALIQLGEYALDAAADINNLCARAPQAPESVRADELQEAAAEVYQCVGTLLSDTGRFDSDEGLMLLDLLSWMAGNRDKRPDTDKLLPFASHERVSPLCPADWVCVPREPTAYTAAYDSIDSMMLACPVLVDDQEGMKALRENFSEEELIPLYRAAAPVAAVPVSPQEAAVPVLELEPIIAHMRRLQELIVAANTEAYKDTLNTFATMLEKLVSMYSAPSHTAPTGETKE